mmetsp:Transcript_11117/g.20928  ORF Transcript_11117/g.20928 Transcript_11117/m.20928 type:complete len:170 (+) Transcript_11117:236-745(+)|eukprot:CAMPEP_0197475142 /NCGR_PEP_ID=MMETSP1309-20131121/6580_1 /TAXON_ID=464262 /ORGANISM="Genus nov. species nov., Strain RCC998" /LENGTH=169 /DNA_ID=CAMNT_0043015051 /DNA_START=156 /DNA_END=665 /DNA_ORIENTATION=-
MSLDCSNQRDAFPSPSPSPSRSAASPSTPLSPQIRVKLSEDVNTKDVLLNLKVKSEEKKKSPAGTYTASPGKVALEGIEDELEATDSPMKQALAAAEAFEKGQSPPDKNQAKKENAAAFENTKASFEVQEDDTKPESMIEQTKTQFEVKVPQGKKKPAPSILERMKMFE